jgi:DNA-binding MarR family transcriptional regulator
MKTNTRFDSLQQQAYLSLWRTYDRLKLMEEAFFARWNLTAQQYNVLRILQASSEPIATLSIASRLVSRAPDITRIIDKLEQQQWLIRSRSDSDRRSVLVSLTPKGKTLLDEMEQGLGELHEQQFGHMDDSNLRILVSLLAEARQPHEPSGSPW